MFAVLRLRLAGKLAAEVVSAKANGLPTKGMKKIQDIAYRYAEEHVPKDPPGVKVRVRARTPPTPPPRTRSLGFHHIIPEKANQPPFPAFF